MMVQPNQEEGVDSGIPIDSHQTPITSQPSSYISQKKQSRRKQRKDTAVLDLEKAKDAQAKEIVDLKKRVQKLERKKKSRTTGLKRLRKVGMSRRVESSEDKDSLGDHEDASKQGRSIKDIDKDANVSLVDDTQGRSDDADMFDINELHGDEVVVDMPVGEKQEQSTKEREVDTSVEVSAAPTTIEEITLAQTLIQIKAAKPKVVTTAATTTTTTRPKARGVVVQEPSEFRTPQASQPSMTKDKGKAIMIEPEVPMKRKDQVALDEDLARNLQAYYEEIQKLFDNEMRRVNTFIPIDSEEVKSTKGTEESSKAESSEEKAKGSRKKMLDKKRAGKEKQQESSKRQRMEDDKETDEHEEVDEAELRKYLVIVKDDDIAIDAIPLATKPPVIVEYKLLREGIMAHYQLIRADGSSKRYSSMIRML
ncbi:hypothetical protein Tco_0650478 [Tanacetum coccineum]